MNKLKISVIVPVYNVEKYLRQCLDSIMNQTLKDIEIICINDGSTDGSLDILMEYASKDARVSVVNQKNCGAGAARNRGIEIAIGEYICFMDSDDFYPNDKVLFNLYGTAKEKNVFLCGGSLSFCNEAGKSIKNNSKEAVFMENQLIEWQKYDNDYYYFRFIYSTRLLKDNDLYFPQYRSYEDPTWFIKVMIYSKNFYAIKDIVYCYRVDYKDRLYNFLIVSDILKSIKLSLELAKRNNYKNLRAVIIKRINSDYFLRIFKNMVKENSDIGIYIKNMLSILAIDELKRLNDFYLPYMCYRLRIIKRVSSFLEDNLLCIKNEGIHKVIRLFRLKIKIKSRRLMLKQELNQQKRELTQQIQELSQELSLQKQELSLQKQELSLQKQELSLQKQELSLQKQELTQLKDCLQLVYSKLFNPCIELDAKNFRPFKIDNKALLCHLKELDEFTYIPNEGNMGDLLIARTTFDFFENHHINYKLFNLESSDTVVYGGGGIWTEYYKQSWQKFLPIFNKAKKIVILPSSFYNCHDLIKIMDDRFTVFCRERQSYDYLITAKTKAKIILDHDMVFRMSEKVLLGKINICEPQAVCLIQEKLKFISPIAKFMRDDLESNGKYENDMDLSSYLHVYGNEIVNFKTSDFGAKLMLSVIDAVDAVITDRLHVAIAGALLGKQVYMLDNSYKKLSEVYKHSLSDMPNVHFCDKMPASISNLDVAHTATDNFKRISQELK